MNYLSQSIQDKMVIKIYSAGQIKISELISKTLIIRDSEDGTDLVGNLYFGGSDRVIIHKDNIDPAFFDLKSGMAGEILQKFSNYRIRLAIVGDFSGYQSKSLNDFIFESNKGNLVNFVGSTEEAFKRLSSTG